MASIFIVLADVTRLCPSLMNPRKCLPVGISFICVIMFMGENATGQFSLQSKACDTADAEVFGGQPLYNTVNI